MNLVICGKAFELQGSPFSISNTSQSELQRYFPSNHVYVQMFLVNSH